MFAEVLLSLWEPSSSLMPFLRYNWRLSRAGQREAAVMGIDFTLEKKPDYLLVTCRGRFAGEGLLDVHREALDMAYRENLRAVLVDTTGLEKRAPTTMTRFGFGKAIAALQQSHSRRISIAFVGAEPLIDPRRLGETAAVNRGGGVRVFESIEAAETWIRTLPAR